MANAPWPVLGQNNQNTGLSPLKGPEIDTMKWKLDDIGGSAPVIGTSGTIYMTKEETLFAIGASNGTKKWHYNAGTTIKNSPTLGHSLIYLITNNGNLHAVTYEGKLQWNHKTDHNFKFTSTIGPGGTIYIGWVKFETNSEPYLYAINPDGSLKWKEKLGSDEIFSPPVIGMDSTIYIASEKNNDQGQLFALNPDRSVKWNFVSAHKGEKFNPPAIGPDHTIYFGSGYNRMYALAPAGTLKWSYRTKIESSAEIKRSPAIGPNGTIYGAATDGNVYAISPAGSLKWKYEIGKTMETSPVVSQDGIIYAGTSVFFDNNYMYAIRQDSTLLWKKQLRGEVVHSAAIGPNRSLYFGTTAFDNLYAIGSSAATSIENKKSVPSRITLKSNFPNPFNPKTHIKFNLPRAAHVLLTVYDALGRQVATLVEGKREAGRHSVTFNAGNLSSGVYLYRLKTVEFAQTRKMMLIK